MSNERQTRRCNASRPSRGWNSEDACGRLPAAESTPSVPRSPSVALLFPPVHFAPGEASHMYTFATVSPDCKSDKGRSRTLIGGDVLSQFHIQRRRCLTGFKDVQFTTYRLFSRTKFLPCIRPWSITLGYHFLPSADRRAIARIGHYHKCRPNMHRDWPSM